MNKLAVLAKAIVDVFPELKFSTLEIGAMPLEGGEEPMHDLMSVFPASHLYAFEPDEAICQKMNALVPKNMTYIPKALSKENGKATLYMTEDRSCYSLYEPNEEFCNLYWGMGGLRTADTAQIDTFTLDSLLESGEVAAPNAIKIDVQGAELDIFRGGEKALESTLFVVTEAEFAPLYKDQPLFPDLFSYMKERGFMFHKFISICGRNIAPVDFGRQINSGSQWLWSDAIFIPDIHTLPTLDSESLVKLALFCVIYQSMDVTYHCLDLVDKKENTNLAESFMQILNS